MFIYDKQLDELLDIIQVFSNTENLSRNIDDKIIFKYELTPCPALTQYD